MTSRITILSDGEAAGRALEGLADSVAQLFDGESQHLNLGGAQRDAQRRARLASTLPTDLLPGPSGAVEDSGAELLSQLQDHVAEAEPELLVIDGEPGSVSGIGVLAERAIRTIHGDTLVIKRPDHLAAEGPILVCIDGSPQSYSGLMQALGIAKRTDRAVEAIAVYDPYIHYTLFNGIVRVLSEQASKVFKFKDQEKLHEEIIDTGLAKIYQAHLEVARSVAEEQEVGIKITLLDGKAYEKIIRHVHKTDPWLIVMGRIGVHSEQDMDIGSNSENILRGCNSNFLVTSSTYIPKIDVQAEEAIEWLPEAKQKMERVPSFVKGVATTAILRWAMERGHSVITSGLINEAMGDLLPPGAAQAMGYVAEEVAKERDQLEDGKTFVCANCGYSARDFRPVACPICKAEGATFNLIDREVLQNIGTLEAGHLVEEAAFDGKILRWSREAKTYMRRVPAGYERRRCRARVEKTARVRGLDTITGPFALEIIQQDLAETSYLSEKGERLIVELEDEEKGEDTVFLPREPSSFTWTNAAWARMLRVPEGFMRDSTRERVEEVAEAKSTVEIDLDLCEEGIAEGRRLMAEMLSNYKKPEAAPTT